MASLSPTPIAAADYLRAILEIDNENRQSSGIFSFRCSPSKASTKSSPRRSATQSSRDHSLDLTTSNADFPVIEATTTNCVQRKSTQKLFATEPEPEPLVVRVIKVCTWPISEALGRMRGKGKVWVAAI